MNKSEILKLSIPVFMGYFPLGLAFGILANSMGISVLITISFSALTYAGAAQFMMLSLFSAGTGLLEIFIVSYFVNLRHTFYGLALLKEYRGLKNRLFNVFMLTDETFAIFKSLKIDNDDERSFVFTWINFLCWFYWLCGSVVGYFLGELITVDMSGLEFSLTALFIVIVMEMFKNDRNFIVLGMACLFGVIGVVFFPPKILLVGSMGLCFAFILVFRNKI